MTERAVEDWVAGLHDSTAEDMIVTAAISRKMNTNRKGTSRFAPDGDLAWVSYSREMFSIIHSNELDMTGSACEPCKVGSALEVQESQLTSKGSNVLLHPMQRQPLISKTDIRIPGLNHLFARDEAPHTQSIICTHAYNRFPNLHRSLHDEREVISLIDAGTLSEATSMDPKCHRKLLVFIPRWPDHIEVEAVLRKLRVGPIIAAITDTRSRVGGCWFGTIPGRSERLRCSEAKIPHRRLCKGDTKKEVLVVFRGINTGISTIFHGSRGRLATPPCTGNSYDSAGPGQGNCFPIEEQHRRIGWYNSK